jgi:uncharacterized protein YrrD
MLQFSGSLLNRPVLSLRTGGQVATTISPIINPNNLKIEGFYCQDAFEHKRTLVLLYQDIRDILIDGFVVDDHDSLVDPSELIRLKDVISLQFDLMGKHVVTASKSKIGKVVDYAAEAETMYIQKLYVGQSLLKNFAGGNLGVDRTQIVEITDKKIIINDIMPGVPAGAGVPA